MGSAIAFEDSSGNKGTVTLAQVIDPAAGASEFDKAETGNRLIAFKLIIAATTGTLDGNANNDASLEGSDNQSYTTDYAEIAGCTNFTSGHYTVPPGRTVTGCVVFELPAAIKVNYFRFGSSYSGTLAEWQVAGSTAATPAPATPPAPSSNAAHVGSAIAFEDSSGNKGTVTLAQVIDPAQSTSEFGRAEAGNRLIAFKLIIAGTTGTLDGNANNDASLEGSDNQSYTADFNDIAGCTNFTSGHYTVPPGRTVTGCVVFELPAAIKVNYFRFGSSYSGTLAEWRVP